MTDATEDDDLLEGFFAAARAAAPGPSAALLARIEAEARDLQAPKGKARSPSRGWARPLVDLLGGWSTMGGLATAAAAGVWIGFAGAGPIGTATGGLIGYEQTAASVDLMPDAADPGLAMENGQ